MWVVGQEEEDEGVVDEDVRMDDERDVEGVGEEVRRGDEKGRRKPERVVREADCVEQSKG
jgi:hypothetical protein